MIPGCGSGYGSRPCSLSSWDVTELCIGRSLWRAQMMVTLRAIMPRMTATGKDPQDGNAVPNKRQLDVMGYFLPRRRGDKLQEHGKEYGFNHLSC